MKQRIITGILAGTGFLVLLWLGDLWFTGLILILALIGFHEFVSIQPERATWYVSVIGYVGLVYIVIPWSQLAHHPWFTDGLATIFNPLSGMFVTAIWLLMFLLLIITVVTKNRISIAQISVIFIGVVYIGLGFHYMLESRWMENGLLWTLFLFLCIWMTDIGGYFAGMFFGKHLLWPAISPKKTIEGSIGGILASTTTAVLVSIIRPELLSIHKAIFLGLIIAIIAQFGDFIQSAYKRVWNVKDSGKLLPGHGGVLDRCDSWLIVFPFIHLLSLIP